MFLPVGSKKLDSSITILTPEKLISSLGSGKIYNFRVQITLFNVNIRVCTENVYKQLRSKNLDKTGNFALVGSTASRAALDAVTHSPRCPR